MNRVPTVLLGSFICLTSVRANAYHRVPDECQVAATGSFADDFLVFNYTWTPYQNNAPFPTGLSRPARVQALLQSYLFQWVLPWVLDMSPDMEPRESAVDVASYFASQLLQSEGFPSDTMAVLLSESSALHPYSAEALAENAATFQWLDRLPDAPIIAQNRALIPTICSVVRVPDCEGALNHILDVMHSEITNLAAYVSLPDEFSQVLSDPIIRQALSQVTLSELTSESDIGSSSDRDVYSDLMQTFEGLGLGSQDAQSYTFTVLGVFGTRGASLKGTEGIFHQEAGPVMSAFYQFSAELGHLDLMRYQAGLRPYSLPAGVTFNCNYGRPYHFWLAAYLSWRLRQDGYDRITTLAAVHLTGVGYEFGMMNDFGKNTEGIYTGPYFSEGNVNVQINIAQDDGGAMFGDSVADRPYPPLLSRVPIDELIAGMFRMGRPMPDLTAAQLQEALQDDIQRYKLFVRVIAPYADLPLMGLSLL